MPNYNRFAKELVNTTDVDATINYPLATSDITLVDLENTAAIAIHAMWTETSVTGSIQVQGSIDGSNWYGLNTAVDLDAETEMWFEDADIAYPYIRLAVTVSADKLDTLKILVAGKG